MWCAHRLEGLEGTVEEEVPDNGPILKGGDEEDEEIANHSQRGGEHDPSRAHVDGGEERKHHEGLRARIYSHAWPFPLYVFNQDNSGAAPQPCHDAFSGPPSLYQGVQFECFRRKNVPFKLCK